MWLLGKRERGRKRERAEDVQLQDEGAAEEGFGSGNYARDDEGEPEDEGKTVCDAMEDDEEEEQEEEEVGSPSPAKQSVEREEVRPSAPGTPEGMWLVRKQERSLLRMSVSPIKQPSNSKRGRGGDNSTGTTPGRSRAESKLAEGTGQPQIAAAVGSCPSPHRAEWGEGKGGDGDEDAFSASRRPVVAEGDPCVLCGEAMMARRGRYGLFWGCSSYQKTGCKFTRRARPPGSVSAGGGGSSSSSLSSSSSRGGGVSVVLEIDGRVDGQDNGEGAVAAEGEVGGGVEDGGRGVEFRAYIWRDMCGVASASTIGGRSAGDECEEAPLRAMLRGLKIRPLRCDWRDDGVYGAVFPLSEYERVKEALGTEALVTGIPRAALAFYRRPKGTRDGAVQLGGPGTGWSRWRERLTPALRACLMPFQEEVRW
jgi:hypothetical protein